MRKYVAALAALLAAAPAAAEIKSAEAVGFEVEAKAVVAASPAKAYAMLGPLIQRRLRGAATLVQTCCLHR